MEWDLQQGARLLRHPFSRFAWRRRKKAATLFCNGLDYTLPVKDAQALAALESLDGPTYAALSDAGRDADFMALASGLRFPVPPPDLPQPMRIEFRVRQRH